MSQDRALEVLKQAILLERQGKAFYEEVARSSQSRAVTDFFRLMAEEEGKHVEILSGQFSSYAAGDGFVGAPEAVGSTVSQVLSGDIRTQISAVSYEAAAISAAIDMENRAVKVYSERAEAAEDPGERELYRWLAQWEKGHLKFLADVNAELLEDVWQENSFWPF